MRNSESDTDLVERGSLYDKIVDAIGIEYNESKFPDVEDYKNHLVRSFGKLDIEDFNKLSQEVRDWVNEATNMFNSNRRTKEEKEPLPDIEGMPEPMPRRVRVSIDDDDEDEEPPAPPPGRRSRVVAAPPPPEDEDEDEEPEPEPDEPEPEPEPEEEAPPPRARRARGAKPVPVKKVSRGARATAPATRRDPDSGRYAKVMPHYLLHRTIEIPELQARIEKVGGDTYSEMTLDRTLAACKAVVGWAERNGVDFGPAMKK